MWVVSSWVTLDGLWISGTWSIHPDCGVGICIHGADPTLHFMPVGSIVMTSFFFVIWLEIYWYNSFFQRTSPSFIDLTYNFSVFIFIDLGFIFFISFSLVALVFFCSSFFSLLRRKLGFFFSHVNI